MRTIFCFASIFLLSCNFSSKTCELKSITNVNKLYLTQKDDKCGEWGGDTRQIVIYRYDFTGDLFAGVRHLIRLCPPEMDEIEELNVKEIKISQEQEFLVLKTIEELVNSKLSTENRPAHAGYRNRVFFNDSSFLVDDYPSIRWETFESLYSSLTTDVQ